MKRLLVLLLISSTIFGAASCSESLPETVPEEEMNRVYEEVKTPFKYGLVIPGHDGLAADSPSVFRKDGKWYMSYIIFDGQGYETWLAESSDLLEWKTLGRIMSFSDDGDWDQNQKAGYMALPNPEWEGSYELEKYNGKYWMSYLGGSKTGYEAGTLAPGMAYTSGDPATAHEWDRLPSPTLSPKDEDASWWDDRVIYKNSVIRDPKCLTGHPFVMYYNAKGNAERIGMAVSDDMEHWQRLGKDPVLSHGDRGITGDAYLQRMGKLWVMFYFGFSWNDETANKAWDSFACSYDLVHWTDWTGDPLIEPSEPFDSRYAHKPCMVKWNGVVYHFYCAVDDNDNRGIALATSKQLNSYSQDYHLVRSYHAYGANQGVAVDDDCFYGIGNQQIVKYSKNGDSLAVWKESDPALIKHFDGGIVVNGLLYCSHSNYPEVPMASSIEVFDPAKMEHVRTISLGIEYGSCTWVVPGEDCWYVCFAHYDNNGEKAGDEVLRDASWTQIIQYDKEWRKLQGWILPQELVEEIRPMSLSGGLFIDGKFYCTGHDARKLYVLEFPPYGMRLRWTGTIEIPFNGQGIALDKEGNLWGIDRKNKLVIKAAK